MRTFKIILFFFFLLFGLYALCMSFVKEQETFSIESKVNHPIDKVFSQFENFQNVVKWNEYFSKNKKLSYNYFLPYVGEGSSMRFYDDQKTSGQLFVVKDIPDKYLEYNVFYDEKHEPYNVGVYFTSKGNETMIKWVVKTPKQPLLRRYENLLAENIFEGKASKSISNLSTLLMDKVEKNELISNIKYDSLMVGNQESQLLIGVNAMTMILKKNNILKEIEENHNKVFGFLVNDLEKNEDEFGFPVLISSLNNLNRKEFNYFYGFKVSQEKDISDNTIIYKKLPKSQVYMIYYQGDYQGRYRAINLLLKKAKEKEMKYDALQEYFIKPPEEGKEVVLKLVLPIHE